MWQLTHISCVFAGKKLSKQEDLKEMGDISSGMSSSIMQLYLKQVLEAFFHTQSSVRHFALNVIALTLNQGLIHPVQVSWRTTPPSASAHSMANRRIQNISNNGFFFIISTMQAIHFMKVFHVLIHRKITQQIANINTMCCNIVKPSFI